MKFYEQCAVVELSWTIAILRIKKYSMSDLAACELGFSDSLWLLAFHVERQATRKLKR